MRKILALILAMTLALSCMSIATSAYGAGETFGIYAGGWGADATVAIPQAGTYTITDPAPEAEAPTETVNTIIDDNFDAEDATIGGWYHHWGNSNNDIVDGALFTNRGESNIMYSTGHDIGAMTAGNTYAVTLKLMVPDEEGACADGKVTATVFFKTDGLDGDVLARKNVELDVNTWSDEVKLTFKAKADVAKAVLCINFDGEGWGNFNPAGLYVDDVLLTETVPAPEPPEEGTPDNLVTIGGKDYLRDEVIDIVGETAVPGSWAWTNLCSYSTTPTVGQVLTALQNENTYLEIDGYAGKIIIQGEGASPSTDSATMVKGKLGYYDLKAVMNAYVTAWNEWVVTENAKIEAANQAIIDANNALPEEERLPEEELELAALKTTVENAYNAWNLVMQNTGSELTIAGAKVVTLTPYVAPEEPVEGKYTGWFVTGPETHAMRIGRAIITLPHEYNANGDCIYCRHHTDLTEEDVEIEVAYESETEETEDDVVVEDENPTTGVALALVPMAVAAAAVISKRR